MMQLAHKRKPATFFGGLIVLIVTIAIIYFFIIFISNYQINAIVKINDKYLITENDLMPDDYSGYANELKSVGADKYTKPIIDYVGFYEDAKKIDRAVRYAVIENQCITRTTLAKIETQIQNKDDVLDEFKETYSKRLNKLYWNSYIEKLESYEIEELKTLARNMPVC